MTTPSLLSGLRVLDLSRMLAGPFCTAMLADLGAEVIKIETPGSGDDARHFAPRQGDESCYFMLINRGKKSVTLNLKGPDGLAVLHGLAAHSDVVVENFKPGVAKRLKIDYKTLSAINPRLIYASISGFGQEGPLAQRPAYDIIAQAMGGIMSINGSPDGPPTRVGESLGDIAAGLYAAWAILAALHARGHSGRGQHLDIAMLDSIFSLLMTALSQYLFTGVVPGRLGNSHPISAPLDSFSAADGHLIIAVANDPMFGRLAEAIGDPTLADDPRFATDSERKLHERELRDRIEVWTRARTTEEAVTALEAASVPASPILSIDQVVASEHVRVRELISEVVHPTAGTIALVPQPVRFSKALRSRPVPPPLLGQHTDAVLQDVLGLAPERIEQLRAAGDV